MTSAFLSPLLPVFAAYLLAVASPGPSTMAIMAVAMRQGRAAGIALALGVVSGSLIWATLAAAGLSALLTAWAGALFAIKLAGGIYLLHLAVKSARAALAPEPRTGAEPKLRTRAALYRRGVLLHLTNPKAVLGWIAILALGLRPAAPAGSLPAILAGCAALGLAVNLGYALAFSTAVMARAYRRARRGIEGALALLFGAAGLRLLWGRP